VPATSPVPGAAALPGLIPPPGGRHLLQNATKPAPAVPPGKQQASHALVIACLMAYK
jgi:hypothetical protein